jgi:hypothetical protein
MTPTAALQANPNHKREMVQQNQRQINQPDEHYKTNSCMSCAVLTNAPKNKKEVMLPIRRCDLSNKVRIENNYEI